MALKVEAKGGKGGNVWDDGFNYENVTKIHVRGGMEGIQFIKFEYVKSGKTTVGPIHGTSGKGLTQTFEIDHSGKEYLVSVDGYYDSSTGVIQSVQFITNKKTSDLMGFNEGTKFSLRANRSKIIGFHGFADKNLISLGAYFIKIPSVKSAMQGGQNTGAGYDDGGDYDGVRKVYVTTDGNAIRHFKIDYDKAGQVESRERGVKTGTVHEFAVNYPYEYITSVEGTHAVTAPYGCIVLTSLTFKTSKGRSSPAIGRVAGTRFVLQSQGNAIVGFHGRVGSCVDSVGAYYAPLPPTTPSVKSAMQGGQTTGVGYDDGGDYDGIRKVYVTTDGNAIRHFKIDYDKAGQVESRERGVKTGTVNEFAINYPYEYITSVEGTHAVTAPYGCIVLTSLTFKTSKGRSSPAIGRVAGTRFVLESQGNAIVGFHGRVGSCVDSVGAYYGPVPLTPPSVKSAMQGGQTTGVGYDDGGDFDGVRKVYVTTDGNAIRHFKIDYDKAGQVESRERGVKTGTVHEFAVNYPYEYITSVEGTHAVTDPYGCIVLTSLTFKTSKGRSSPAIGRVAGTRFVLQSQGNAIVGFHGRVGSCVDSVGAYYAPAPLTPPPEKLEGQGGQGGDSWDDGAFQNVKKIYVGQGENGVVSVKFVYVNDAGEVVVGAERGKKTLLGYEEFELDYPSEYITSVEGCFDKISGAESGIITMLRFKTNKRISEPFGLESGSKFVIQKEGHKITGFHGKASTMIHQIGVHVVPINE